jgi:hypothetical protein
MMVLHHVGGLRVFLVDCVIFTHESERRLVVKVPPLTLHLLMDFRQQIHRLSPAVAAPFASADAPLRGFQRPFGLAIPAGREDARAFGEGSEGFASTVYPKVDAGFLSSHGKRLYGHVVTRAANVPTVRFSGDRDRLGAAFTWTGPADGDAPDLGQDQKSIVHCHSVAELWISEAAIAITSMQARVARCLARFHPAEERLEGAIYPQHHILQDVAVDFSVLWRGFLDVGQFRFLLRIGDRNTALVPGFPTLADGGIVDVAAEHQRTLQHPLLFGSGLTFVLVGLANALRFHAALFCPTGANLARSTIRRLMAARLSSHA